MGPGKIKPLYDPDPIYDPGPLYDPPLAGRAEEGEGGLRFRKFGKCSALGSANTLPAVPEL